MFLILIFSRKLLFQVSKATMLSKTSHYIKTLQMERAKQKEEIEALKKDLEKLHLAIKYVV